MTDDRRIELLTEVAREVWPDAFVEIRPCGDGTPECVVYRSKLEDEVVMVWHPRALAAVEAAIWALVEPDSHTVHCGRGEEGRQRARKVGQAIHRARLEAYELGRQGVGPKLEDLACAMLAYLDDRGLATGDRRGLVPGDLRDALFSALSKVQG